MLQVSRDHIRSDYIINYPAEDRFIKIPIENYLSLLTDDRGNQVEPISPQIALINALNDPEIRFVVAALSRRTGKTFISNVIAQLLTFIPNTHVLIMSPNYNLSTISWDIQRKFYKKFDIKLVKQNAKDKVLELENGSTVRMGSISQADSVVGRSYDFILFDEAALDSRGIDAWNIQLRPTLDKPNSKAVFISTPRGKNYFHEFFQRGFSDKFPEWASIHSDYAENPRASTHDIEQARKSMSSAEFAQEYMADFVSMQGQIYSLADKCRIDMTDEYLASLKIMDVIIGMDIGFRDFTSLAVMLTDGYNIYIVDEYQAHKKSTAAHAVEINRLINKWNADFVYIDSAAAQTKFDLAMQFGISTVNANKSVLDGIGYVASLAEHGRIFVSKKCIHVLDMFDNYVWDDRTGLLKERPKHDDFSHMADAIRYGLYSHSFNLESI